VHTPPPPQHIATPHIPVQPHVAAPAHVVPPEHVATPSHLTPAEVRQQSREARHPAPNLPAEPGNATKEGAKSLAHRGEPPTPVVGAPNPTSNREQRGTTAPSLAGEGANKGGRNVAALPTPAQTHAQARAQIYVPGRTPVLHNPVLANLSARDPAARELARSTFRGRFAEFRDRREDRREDRLERRAIVLGWIGPVFWPYAYADVFDYTLWPYATDTFWPYAYDDIYTGIFGNYAPDLTGYAYPSGTVGYGGRRVARVTTGLPPVGAGEVCTGQENGLADWPVGRIAEQVQPDASQQDLLGKLKDATTRAVQVLQSACPTDLPATPTGRLAAVRQRIDAMLQAVRIIRPPLEAFYQSLSDEQKERFNALDIAGVAASTASRTKVTAGRQPPDLSQVCSGQTAQVTNVPIDRIDQVLRLDQSQRSALEDLNKASAAAADLLSRNCPQDDSLTPPGRIAAMEQRLNAMLQALDTVQPALAKFYNSLSDEQKARFDRMPRPA
jgi:hypothetical protein